MADGLFSAKADNAALAAEFEIRSIGADSR
jgi:hypothetical protein